MRTQNQSYWGFMRSQHPLQDRWLELLDSLRLRLSGVDALPQLALLGLLSGGLAGGVTIAFRLLIESVQAGLLPGGQPENYESLTLFARFLAATGGGLAVGLALQLLDPNIRRVGVVHVMERLAYHQGHLPLGNALVQFLPVPPASSAATRWDARGLASISERRAAVSWVNGCIYRTTASAPWLPAALQRPLVPRSTHRWLASSSRWKW
jgi:hypothetical protein